MLDRLLRIGCSFDWITPTVAFAQDLLNGPSSDFGIPENAGWSRRDVKQLLTRHGVRVWGLMLALSEDMLMFTVPKSQAKWAYYLLQREGIPILYAPAEAINSPTQQIRKKADSATPLDLVTNFLDKLHEDRF